MYGEARSSDTLLTRHVAVHATVRSGLRTVDEVLPAVRTMAARARGGERSESHGLAWGALAQFLVHKLP
jgi:hypothetical protein